MPHVREGSEEGPAMSRTVKDTPRWVRVNRHPRTRVEHYGCVNDPSGGRWVLEKRTRTVGERWQEVTQYRVPIRVEDGRVVESKWLTFEDAVTTLMGLSVPPARRWAAEMNVPFLSRRTALVFGPVVDEYDVWVEKFRPCGLDSHPGSQPRSCGVEADVWEVPWGGPKRSPRWERNRRSFTHGPTRQRDRDVLRAARDEWNTSGDVDVDLPERDAPWW